MHIHIHVYTYTFTRDGAPAPSPQQRHELVTLRSFRHAVPNLDSTDSLNKLCATLEVLLTDLQSSTHVPSQLTQMEFLEGAFQHLDFRENKRTGIWGTLFLHASRAVSICQRLSKETKLKGQALRVIATIVTNSANMSLSTGIGEFLKKRIIRHIDDPRKAWHCLQVILIVVKSSLQYSTGAGGFSKRVGAHGGNKALSVAKSCLSKMHVRAIIDAISSKKPIRAVDAPLYRTSVTQLLSNILLQLSRHDHLHVVNMTLPGYIEKMIKNPQVCVCVCVCVPN